MVGEFAQFPYIPGRAYTDEESQTSANKPGWTRGRPRLDVLFYPSVGL